MVLIEDTGPIETHKVHSERLMRHAEEQLAKGDRLQASEKAWGAAVHRLKDIANKRGWKYDTHTEAYAVIRRLVEETNDPQLRRLFRVASNLHRNYYLDAEPLEELAVDIDDVRLLLRKLDDLDQTSRAVSRTRRPSE